MDTQNPKPETVKPSNGCTGHEPSSNQNVLDFINDLSAHGIKYWLNWERSFWVRVIWLWAFGLAFGYSLYMIFGHFQSYLKQDLRVSAAFHTWDETVFPAVTICPHNSVVKSIVSGSMAMLTLLSQVLNSKYNVSLCFDPNNTHPMKEELDRGFEFFFSRGGSAQALSLIVEDATRNAIICEWLGEPVNCSSLFRNILPDYGICFTFNAGFIYDPFLMWPEPVPLQNVSSSGIASSLRILLRTKPEEYCIPLCDSVGYTVHVHDPDLFPIFIRSKGQFVSPGFSTKLKISTTHTTRYTEWMGRCKSRNEEHPEIFGEDYKKDSCHKQCIILSIVQKCHCLPQFSSPNFELIGERMIDYLDKENASMRNGRADMYKCVISEQRRICQNEQMDLFLHANLDEVCDFCLADCNEVNYNLQSSFAYYPTQIEYQKVRRVVNFSLDMTETKFRQEFVDLTLYLAGNSESVVVEEVRIGFNEFLANVGGALGLFVGMSFLSLAEFIQLGVIVLRWVL